MADSDNWQPVGAQATLSATSTSSSVAIPTDAPSVMIANIGPNTAFYRMGVGAQTAVATDAAIPAGGWLIRRKPATAPTADTLAAITASGHTATLYVSGGTGS